MFIVTNDQVRALTKNCHEKNNRRGRMKNVYKKKEGAGDKNLGKQHGGSRYYHHAMSM